MLNILHKQILFIIFFSMFAIALSSGDALCNGAAFNPGLPTGSPHPVQQNDLFLEREHVTIQNQIIKAKFWVRNPTKTDISVLMGFPIDYKDETDRRYPTIAIFNNIFQSIELSDLDFSVEVNGKKIGADFSKNLENDYPILYTWNMTFPGNKISEFTVQYKYLYGYGTDSASFGSSFIHYITHTGSYWARPIENAKFEYCNADVVDFLIENEKAITPSDEKLIYSTWIDNGDTELTIEYSFVPKPYNINPISKCIEWERKSWKPVVHKDDIDIHAHWRKEVYIGGYIQGGRQDFFSNMCAKDDGYREPNNISKFLANELKEGDLEKYVLEEIDSQSFTWDGHVDHSIYPAHLLTDLQLLVLRFLRNYIYAIHGHEFKDKDLAKCFAGMPQKKDWSQIEKNNINIIEQVEKKLKKRNEQAWDAVKNNIKKRNEIKIPETL